MRAALPALLGLAGVLFAGEDLTVLKDTNGVPPCKLLYEYLRGECQKHFDVRRQVIAQLKTPADVQAGRRMLRARFASRLDA